MAKLEVTEFDFDDIKSNLKLFMKNQSTFTDYDFEGSGMSNLIDLLAYNTHYLGYNMNMLANEMFVDSAALRSSVVSHARTLGYESRSATAATATVNITLNTSSLSSATISSSSNIFTGTIDGVSYQFHLLEDVTTTSSGNHLTFNSVKLYEGNKIVTNYTVDTSNIDQKFLLTDVRTDTTTLKVEVFDTVSSTAATTYTKATDITQITSTSAVYFLQEIAGGKYEVYFGDGVIGTKLVDGNIIKLTSIVTNKADGNGISSFTSSGAIGGITDINVVTVSNSSGGAEPETIASIRQNAPLDYASQGRCVTTEDYKLYVKKLFANTKTVAVWGGEDGSFDSSLGVVDTPEYGKVFISVKSTTGNNLTTTEKSTLENNLGRYKVASITPVVVDPETLYLVLTVSFKFDSTKTSKTLTDLETDVFDTISEYNTSTLLEFGNIFRHSEMTTLIDNTHASILNNTTNINLVKYLIPTTTTSTTYNIYFRNNFFNPHVDYNKIAGGIIASTGFKISGDLTNIFYFDDDGAGNLRRYYLDAGTRVYKDSLAGTVSYTGGTIAINSIQISTIEDIDGLPSTQIRFAAVPNSKDIVPVRNQILEIDLINTAVVGGVDNISVGSSSNSSYTTSSSNPNTTAF